MAKKSIFTIIILIFCSCNDNSKNLQVWEIGGKHGMSKVIFEQDQAADIKFCSDKYKDIGFSTNINIDYDENTYYRLFEGLCITINAKKVRVRFATPSSGKMARGTFEILDS